VDGKTLVGWGSAPFILEYDSAGRLLLDAAFPGHDLSYRAMLDSDDAREGPRAFASRRTPVWQGR